MDYGKKRKTMEYNGCLFESLLELKFVILIEDQCSYLVHPIHIYSDQDGGDPNNTVITESTKLYVPDFLVRKWSDNTGFLIEVKPRIFIDNESVKYKQMIAEEYIKRKKLDWQYKIVTDEMIKLSESKMTKFLSIRSNRGIYKFKQYLRRIGRIDRKAPHPAHNRVPIHKRVNLSNEEYVKYVKFGILPENKKYIYNFFESDS